MDHRDVLIDAARRPVDSARQVLEGARRFARILGAGTAVAAFPPVLARSAGPASAGRGVHRTGRSVDAIPACSRCPTTVVSTMNADAPAFYVTTAIAYPNGAPHIGHAYEYISSDAIARFKRLDGFDVFFMIGLPGQSLESVRGTVDYCERLFQLGDARLSCYISPMGPFLDPGSRGFEEPARFGYGLLLLFWTVVGWEIIGNYSAEIRDPGRTIPRSVALSVAVALL